MRFVYIFQRKSLKLFSVDTLQEEKIMRDSLDDFEKDTFKVKS